MDFELQQISIPKGCQIIQHCFTTYDPETAYSEERNCLNLTEDLLQIEFANLHIIVDLGWYGEVVTNDGCFKIFVVKNRDWENPLRIEASKSQKIITEKLTQILIGVKKGEI